MFAETDQHQITEYHRVDWEPDRSTRGSMGAWVLALPGCRRSGVFSSAMIGGRVCRMDRLDAWADRALSDGSHWATLTVDELGSLLRG